MTTRLTLLLRLALRNVRRQARRSMLTAAAMVIGLALLMFSRSLGEGAHEDWIEAGVRLGSGHVTIQDPVSSFVRPKARTTPNSRTRFRTDIRTVLTMASATIASRIPWNTKSP